MRVVHDPVGMNRQNRSRKLAKQIRRKSTYNKKKIRKIEIVRDAAGSFGTLDLGLIVAILPRMPPCRPPPTVHHARCSAHVDPILVCACMPTPCPIHVS